MEYNFPQKSKNLLYISKETTRLILLLFLLFCYNNKIITLSREIFLARSQNFKMDNDIYKNCSELAGYLQFNRVS